MIFLKIYLYYQSNIQIGQGKSSITLQVPALETAKSFNVPYLSIITRKLQKGQNPI